MALLDLSWLAANDLVRGEPAQQAKSRAVSSANGVYLTNLLNGRRDK